MARHKKYDDKSITKLGERLLKLAKEDGVYHVTEFSELEKKSPTWIYEIAREYPKFSEYLTRARGILGRKLLKLSVEANPSQYIQKTFIKRYLSNEYEDINAWVKEDIEIEAKAKAEAAKAANLADVDPRILQFISMLEGQKNVTSS